MVVDLKPPKSGEEKLAAKQEQVEKMVAAKREKRKFDFSTLATDKFENKTIIAVYGDKNNGKTTTCYGIPKPGQKMLVLSFDHKSTRPVKELHFVSSSGVVIAVIDAVERYDCSTQDSILATSELVLYDTMDALEQSETDFQPDWIVFDGTEDLSAVSEMVMRIRNSLRPYQGISNLNLWKERKQYLEDIHRKALRVAKCGVMYTMYADVKEVKDTSGNVVRVTETPKWFGVVMKETDVTIKSEYRMDKNKPKQFINIIMDSKLPTDFPDGVYDVTQKRLSEVLNGE